MSKKEVDHYVSTTLPETLLDKVIKLIRDYIIPSDVMYFLLLAIAALLEQLANGEITSSVFIIMILAKFATSGANVFLYIKNKKEGK